MKNTFGEWLTLKRQELDLSQYRLADLADIPRSTISKIESGTIPMPDTLVRLARGMNIPAQELFVAAGYLPSPTDRTKEEWEIFHLLKQLPEDKKREVLDYIQFKISSNL